MLNKFFSYLIKEAVRPAGGGGRIPVSGMNNLVKQWDAKRMKSLKPLKSLTGFRKLPIGRALSLGTGAALGGGLLWAIGNAVANKDRPSVGENITNKRNQQLREAGLENMYLK